MEWDLSSDERGKWDKDVVCTASLATWICKS